MAFIDSREAVKVKRSVVMPVSRRLRRRYGALHKECVELYTHRRYSPCGLARFAAVVVVVVDGWANVERELPPIGYISLLASLGLGIETGFILFVIVWFCFFSLLFWRERKISPLVQYVFLPHTTTSVQCVLQVRVCVCWCGDFQVKVAAIGSQQLQWSTDRRPVKSRVSLLLPIELIVV